MISKIFKQPAAGMQQRAAFTIQTLEGNGMKKLAQNRFIGLISRVVSRILEMNIPVWAAYASYFLILSVFPALLLILSSLHFTGVQVHALIEMLEQILPEPLMEVAQEIVWNTYRQTSGAMAGISALIALWSSSKGTYGMLLGLNAIYGVSEDRGYVYTRGISVLYSLGFVVVITLTLLLHVFGNTIMELLLHVHNPVVVFLVDMIDFHTIFLLSLQILLFTLMYMVLPNHHNGFLSSLPGGFFSALGWQLFSKLYSMYVSVFTGYASVYGSVYAIAIAMLWLYFCVSILFYGGALNKLLQTWRANRIRQEPDVNQ